MLRLITNEKLARLRKDAKNTFTLPGFFVVAVVVVVVILVAALLEGVLDESLVEMIFSVKDEGEVEVVVAAGVKAVE